MKKVPKRRRTTSFGHLVCFLLFYFHITNYFFRYNTCFPTSTTCFFDNGHNPSRQREWRGNELQGKRPRDVVWHLLGIRYVFFIFIFILLTTFFRYNACFPTSKARFFDDRHNPSQQREWRGNERAYKENAQKTLYDVFWAFGMFFFSFILILLTTFF